MPCQCKRTPVNVPDNAEWGPALWKVLHGLAQLAGRQTNPNIRRDEMLHWKHLLKTLHTVLPCEDCREHLVSYVAHNPIDIPESYEQIGVYVRTWLYKLHENVNQRLGKPSFPFAQLANDPDHKQSFAILQVIMKRAVVSSAVHILDWTKWSNNVRIMMGMY
jgi:hypothetical protein